MPNRIVREGILTSRRVNRLSAEEEVFFFRLLLAVDDFGRTFADPSLLRARLYPWRLDEVGEAAIEGFLRACEAADLLVLYTVDGERYLEVHRTRQQIRSKASKHPAPADAQQALGACVVGAAHARTKAETDPEAKSKTKPTEEREGPSADEPPTLALSGDERNQPKNGSKARPRSVEEVRAYIAEIGAAFSAEKFLAHQEAAGWKWGKARHPVKDWKAVARTWKANDDEQGIAAAPKAQAGPPAVPDWKRRLDDEDAARAAAEVAEAERLRKGRAVA